MGLRFSGQIILAASCLIAAGFPAGTALASATSQREDAVAYQINPAHSGSIDFAAGFGTPLVKLWSQSLGSALSYPVI